MAMRKLDEARDYEGRPVAKGDTVSTLNGQLTARVCDIADNGEMVFVRLRPLHQPYGKGTWHAADRLIWVAAATRRKRKSRSASSATGTAEGSSPSPSQDADPDDAA